MAVLFIPDWTYHAECVQWLCIHKSDHAWCVYSSRALHATMPMVCAQWTPMRCGRTDGDDLHAWHTPLSSYPATCLLCFPKQVVVLCSRKQVNIDCALQSSSLSLLRSISLTLLFPSFPVIVVLCALRASTLCLCFSSLRGTAVVCFPWVPL